MEIASSWPSENIETVEQLQEQLDAMVKQGVIRCCNGRYYPTELGLALHAKGLNNVVDVV